MIRLLPWLLLSLGIPGHAAEDDDPWMKAPDGYVWPEDAEVKLEDAAQLQFADLPQEIRACITARHSPQAAPAQV